MRALSASWSRDWPTRSNYASFANRISILRLAVIKLAGAAKPIAPGGMIKG